MVRGVTPSPGRPGPVQTRESDAAVGVTGSIQALRRRVGLCLLLLVGIFVAGLAMGGPASHRASRVSTGEVAAPSPATTATTATSEPAPLPTTPFTTPLPGLPTPSTPSTPSTSVTHPPARPSGTTPPPAPSTTTAARPATCGDQALAKADGGTWRCTFDDEFDGTAVDTSKWRIQETAWNGFHSGAECFVNDPDNVSVANGTLRLTVRKERTGFTCGAPKKPYGSQYTSGMVTSFGKFTQAYGRFEVRAKVTAATIKGLQSSFWLWPENAGKYGSLWPASGEIDIAELYSRWPDRAIPYLHYTGSTYNVTNNNCIIGDQGQFHTYTVVWTTSTMTFTYDGQTCLVSQWYPLGLTPPAPFDQPFMISLTQALGIDSNAFLPDVTPLPATTTVDYVRVWK
jgi:beta-glucanase (GH16 family)